jgi:ribosomal protein S18 acetylase RimI-like enzyme
MAKERGISTVGVHTTEDNIAARGLYTWAGYTVTEIGPCTTADGVDRVGYTFQKQV